MKKSMVSTLFVIAALYDGLLGLAFLIAPEAVFKTFAVTPPNHFGYVQFPAALLLTFAIMFAAVAKDPARNRCLIPYGLLLKCAYCGVAFGHWFAGGIPYMWKPFAVCDLVFLGLFAWAYQSLGKMEEGERGANHDT
jgi:hypothetical protein